jgi:hypothetical protein
LRIVRTNRVLVVFIIVVGRRLNAVSLNRYQLVFIGNVLLVDERLLFARLKMTFVARPKMCGNGIQLTMITTIRMSQT